MTGCEQGTEHSDSVKGREGSSFTTRASQGVLGGCRFRISAGFPVIPLRDVSSALPHEF